MLQTHVEYDDFGEYVETIDLMPITASQAGQQDSQIHNESVSKWNPHFVQDRRL